MRALALLVALAGPALAQPAAVPMVTVPGTTVEVPVPAGFELADGFAGLQHRASGASVVVAQLRDTPLGEIRLVLLPDSLLRRGFEVAATRDTTVGGAAGLWTRGEQRDAGRTVDKRILAVETPSGVTVLSASVPRGAPDVLAAVETVLFGARLDAPPPADVFAGLPFSATLPPALDDVQRTGRTAVATNGGVTAAGRVAYTVGLERGPPPGDGSLEALAANRMTFGLSATLAPGEAETRALTVDGRRAAEVVLEARDTRDGSARKLYLVLVPMEAPGHYVLVQGFAGPDRELWLERFRAATETVRWAR